MSRMEELEDVLLSDKVASLDLETWVGWLREYMVLRELGRKENACANVGDDSVVAGLEALPKYKNV